MIDELLKKPVAPEVIAQSLYLALWLHSRGRVHPVALADHVEKEVKSILAWESEYQPAPLRQALARCDSAHSPPVVRVTMPGTPAVTAIDPAELAMLRGKADAADALLAALGTEETNEALQRLGRLVQAADALKAIDGILPPVPLASVARGEPIVVARARVAAETARLREQALESAQRSANEADKLRAERDSFQERVADAMGFFGGTDLGTLAGAVETLAAAVASLPLPDDQGPDEPAIVARVRALLRDATAWMQAAHDMRVERDAAGAALTRIAAAVHLNGGTAGEVADAAVARIEALERDVDGLRSVVSRVRLALRTPSGIDTVESAKSLHEACCSLRTEVDGVRAALDTPADKDVASSAQTMRRRLDSLTVELRDERQRLAGLLNGAEEAYRMASRVIDNVSAILVGANPPAIGNETPIELLAREVVADRQALPLLRTEAAKVPAIAAERDGAFAAARDALAERDRLRAEVERLQAQGGEMIPWRNALIGVAALLHAKRTGDANDIAREIHKALIERERRERATCATLEKQKADALAELKRTFDTLVRRDDELRAIGEALSGLVDQPPADGCTPLVALARKIADRVRWLSARTPESAEASPDLSRLRTALAEIPTLTPQQMVDAAAAEIVEQRQRVATMRHTLACLQHDNEAAVTLLQSAGLKPAEHAGCEPPLVSLARRAGDCMRNLARECGDLDVKLEGAEAAATEARGYVTQIREALDLPPGADVLDCVQKAGNIRKRRELKAELDKLQSLVLQITPMLGIPAGYEPEDAAEAVRRIGMLQAEAGEARTIAKLEAEIDRLAEAERAATALLVRWSSALQRVAAFLGVEHTGGTPEDIEDMCKGAVRAQSLQPPAGERPWLTEGLLAVMCRHLLRFQFDQWTERTEESLSDAVALAGMLCKLPYVATASVDGDAVIAELKVGGPMTFKLSARTYTML